MVFDRSSHQIYYQVCKLLLYLSFDRYFQLQKMGGGGAFIKLACFDQNKSKFAECVYRITCAKNTCFIVVLEVTTWCSPPHRPQCTVTLNSNFAIFKKSEIVFNKEVDQLSECAVLWNRGIGLKLYLYKAFPWETNLWVMLGEWQ